MVLKVSPNMRLAMLIEVAVKKVCSLGLDDSDIDVL